MILSDSDLLKKIQSKELEVHPLADGLVQPASIDIQLGRHFSYVDNKKNSELSLSSKVEYEEIETDSFVIQPKNFVLATTKQYIKLPANLTALVEGRSSIGRLGLFIQNAGLIDPGFEGEITLELFNASSLPIRLEAGRRICQLVFYEMTSTAKKPYAGKYQKQQGATGSRIFQDAETTAPTSL